ncbi:Hypothetical protein R9X50_00751500 [Acrodontium crateriforme]|uniref:Uncharacterized protein n=1 Tax=Acrodontium crateriforme TaxID=150365 RepID=A0AAQ3MDZ4_9PEZI|nr:Hypothetical protein R9X50_00751500 [Acrodontium crateriforme]
MLLSYFCFVFSGSFHFTLAELALRASHGPYIRGRDGQNTTSVLLGTGASTTSLSSSSASNSTNHAVDSSSASVSKTDQSTTSTSQTLTDSQTNTLAAIVSSSQNGTSSSGATTQSITTSYIKSTIAFVVHPPPMSAPLGTGPQLSGVNATTTYTGTAPLGTGLTVSASNKTSMASASSCNAAKQEWAANYGQTYVSDSTFTTSTSSISYTVTRSAWTETFLDSPQPFTLCDGYPRLNGSTTITSIDTTPAVTYIKTFVTTTPVSRNVSAPTCTIPPMQCSELSSEYTTSISAYDAYIDAWNSGSRDLPQVPFPTPPICGAAVPANHTSMVLGNAACAVQTASLRLLYWPVETVSGNLCLGNGSTITPTPTIAGSPNTVVYMNTTLTSPTVYMEFKGLWQVDSGDYPISSYQETLLALAPTAVSSRCGKIGGGFGPPMSMNYANLNQPVPAEAYRCQPKCFTNDDLPQLWTRSDYSTFMQYATDNRCSTIWDDYNPALAVPTEFATVFPSAGFEDEYPGLPCTFYLGSVEADGGLFFDPPSALQPVNTIAGPTTPVNAPVSSLTGTPTPNFNSPVGSSDVTIPTPKSLLNDPSSPANSKTTAISAAPASTTPKVAQSTTQGVGDIIASIIGVTQSTTKQDLPANGPATASSAVKSSDLPKSVLTVNGNNGQVVTAVKSSNNIVIGSATVQVGATTVLQGIGTVVAQSSALVVAGNTKSFEAAASSTNPPGRIITVAGSTVTQNSNSQFIIGSQTLAPGGSAITVAGNTISLDSAGSTLIVNGDTQTIVGGGASATGGVFTVNGRTITPDSSAGVTIGGTALQPGSQTVIAGTTFSLDPSGSALVVNGVTQTLQTSPSNPTPGGIFTVGGQTLTENPSSGVIIAGATLLPGSQTVLSGTTFSLDPSGSALIINGVTQTLQTRPNTLPGGIFTFNGETITENPSSNLVISGKTVFPGQSTIISGTTYFLDGSGSTLVVDGSTVVVEGTTQTPQTTSGSAASLGSSASQTSIAGEAQSTGKTGGAKSVKGGSLFVGFMVGFVVVWGWV